MNTDGRLPNGACKDPNAPYNEEEEIRKAEVSICVDGEVILRVPKGISSETFSQLIMDKIVETIKSYKFTLTDIWVQET